MKKVYCQGSTNMDILLKGRHKLEGSNALLKKRDIAILQSYVHNKSCTVYNHNKEAKTSGGLCFRVTPYLQKALRVITLHVSGETL